MFNLMITDNPVKVFTNEEKNFARYLLSKIFNEKEGEFKEAPICTCI